MIDTTLDGLLNRRVALDQPELGYRVAIDTVLLAAAVPAQTSDKVLDLGCGVGGAMLCLACRVPEIAVTGIEIQDELFQLCLNNIARNKFQAELNVTLGDATKLPESLFASFDHVMMNPPFHDERRHDVSTQLAKRLANAEKDGELPLWIKTATAALKPSGMLTLIHRADRQAEILTLLQKDFSAMSILSLVPKTGTPPKRVIIQAQKGTTTRQRQCKNFVLHKLRGGYTTEAEAILRDMQSLPMT